VLKVYNYRNNTGMVMRKFKPVIGRIRRLGLSTWPLPE
jgi:hypothetical protein